MSTSRPDRTTILISLGALTLSLASGCGGLTREEAKAALEEIELNSQVSALTSNSVEVATDFTIGDAVEQAAANLRDFIETQMPCAEVTREGSKLTVEYGARSGNCTWRGQRFSGKHEINVQSNGRDLVQVDHLWTDFSNQRLQFNGEAMVTWDFEDRSRRVVHSGSWLRFSDGREGQGGGDRTQRPLGGNLLVGMEVEGEREWRGKSGDWELGINGIEMRWIDPVPQAGSYVLDTPFDKRVSARFERQTDTKIKVTIEGPRREFSFDVLSLP